MDELQIHQKCCLFSKGSPKVPLGFQKNYPKNIFIPIIEHLSDLGFQEMYQKCVGTRQLFEGKNVVSLAVIHQLLTQKWFIEGVDRCNLLRTVCSKILLNSKIKKKIFHLKVAAILINTQIANQKEFKTSISKQVSSLATSSIEDDQFLSYPNLTVYLFHLLTQVLCIHLHPQPCCRHQIKNTQKGKLQHHDKQEEEASQTHLSSKQEFRLYLKAIIRIFQQEKHQNNRFPFIYEEFCTFVQQRSAQFQEKYGLPQGILNQRIFIKQIGEKLFSSKQKRIKITNLLLSQWIDNFKAGCLQFKPKEKLSKMSVEQQFTHHEEICGSAVSLISFISRTFTPYILVLPCNEQVDE